MPERVFADRLADAPEVSEIDKLDDELLLVRKEFDDIVAVNDVDVTFEAGDFVSLVGPSGCSKTTTLRMIAGLETPTSGRVRFGGEDLTDAPPQQRPISMVFQNTALFPHMTCRENIGYGLKVRLMVGDVEAYDAFGHVPEATGNVSPNAVPRNIYETADGYISLSASTQRIFENVMAAIGREDLVEDERFATNEAGIHTEAMLSEPSSFEPFDPALFGGERTLLFGADTGESGAATLLELADIEADPAVFLELLECEGPLTRDEALALARRELT